MDRNVGRGDEALRALLVGTREDGLAQGREELALGLGLRPRLGKERRARGDDEQHLVAIGAGDLELVASLLAIAELDLGVGSYGRKVVGIDLLQADLPAKDQGRAQKEGGLLSIEDWFGKVAQGSPEA